MDSFGKPKVVCFEPLKVVREEINNRCNIPISTEFFGIDQKVTGKLESLNFLCEYRHL